MNIFNNVKGLHPRHNAFSADTYRNDFTANLGVNIPCYIQHVPPATRIKCTASALVRLQALISPVMDNIDYYTHFWKCPYRVLENDLFTQFISGEIAPEDYDALFCTPYELAQAIFAQTSAFYQDIVGNGSLLDFLGYDKNLFPTVVNGELSGGNRTTKFNFRGLILYFLLHQNWYMNENVEYFNDFSTLVDKLVKEQSLDALAKLLYYTAVFNSNGGQYERCTMLPHAWPKDYFTGALPNVQYGDPVRLGIAGTAPVTLNSGGTTPIRIGPNSASVGLTIDAGVGNVFEGNSEDGIQSYVAESNRYAEIVGRISRDGEETFETLPLQGLLGTLQTPLEGIADLSEASAISINELRFANALQVFKERQLRYGRRRQEYYKGFFDVEPEDLRLQLPKYLGGGRIPINIADIEQTSRTDEDQALGRLAGKATAVAGGFAGFSTFCSEESVIIGISFAMPHVTYANQTSRFLLKTNDIYDYFNPSFEHLGEQAIKKVEVFAGSNIDPEGDFAYVPRYSEYRFHLNEMHGAFKDTLAYWTLGRIFQAPPVLNARFIYMQPQNFNRIFAVEGEPPMLVSMLFRVRSIKPVSKWGTPMLLA